MTTVQWLEQEFLKLESTVGVHGVMYELLEKAKEMEYNQMKNAVLDQVTSHPRFRNIFEKQFEQWYTETYGSKGNDEYTEVNWGGVIQKIPKTGSGELEQINQDNPVTKGSTALVKVTSPQTEISDEEWVGCHGCTETDEYFWKKGFQAGYTKAKPVEISDIEIGKAANEYSSDISVLFFKAGAKWYREQLKKNI